MLINPKDPAFSAEYIRVARNRDIIDDLVVIDPSADDRPFGGAGAPLVVPVDVQALVVTGRETQPRADVGVRLLDAESFEASVDRASVPFTDAEKLPPGVHVHWAMPDGLTQGAVAEDGLVTQAALPDRWLVVRLVGGVTRPWAAWVVESDFGRATPLWLWDGEPEQPTDDPPPGWVPRDRLSATAGGDPAWAAIYDNVGNRFGFHDDLRDAPDLTGQVLSYVVVGWYGDQSLDPLAAVRSGGAFDAALAGLRWTIEKGERAELGRFATIIAAANVTSRVSTDRRSSVGNATRPARGVGSLGDLLDVAVLPERAGAWPRRCVMHGAVVGVMPDGRGDNRPSSSAVRASVGATATEALAALIGAAQGAGGRGESQARATAAFAYGVIDRLGEHDGPAVVDEHLHTRAFTSQPGGWAIDHIRTGDRLKASRPKRPKGGFVIDGVLKEADLGVLTGTAMTIDPDLLHGVAVHEVVTSRTHGLLAERLMAEGLHTVAPGSASIAAERLGAGGSSATVDGPGLAADVPSMADGGRSILAPRSVVAEVAEATAGTWAATIDFALRREDLRVPRYPEERLREAVDRLRLGFKQVRRPLPRWFQPQDPVLAVQGTKRNLRHGHDGRFTADESTACRLRGGIADRWDDLDGASVLARPLAHIGLPPEAALLLHEAVLEDLSQTVQLTRAAVGRATGQVASVIAERIAGEHAIGRYGRDPELQTGGLAAVSTRDGTISSALAMTVWRGQPWIPLYLEWELALDLSDRIEGWELGEIDLDPPATLPPTTTRVLAGRSLLASASVKALSSEVQRALEEEDLADLQDRGLLPEQVESQLRQVASTASTMDVLSAGLDGLREHLLGMDTNLVLQARPANGPLATPSDVAPPEPLPTAPAMFSRAGLARLTRLRIVDAFGRALDVPLDDLLTSDALRVPAGLAATPDPAAPDADAPEADAPSTDPTPAAADASVSMLLRPRVDLPARMLLRLVDAEDDALEVGIDQRLETVPSPVTGWLVADHIDHALEVFDAAGAPIGQLRHDVMVAPDHGGAVVWEGVPGEPGPTGVSPDSMIANRHTRQLVTRLLARDLARRESPAAADRESPLSGMLRMLDTTQWTVDPVSTLGWEFPAALVGRPLAIVRARLTLDIMSDLDDERWDDEPAAAAARAATFDRLRSRSFEVRLGSLTRMQDGLFAYVVDDDYWHLHPVHPSVLNQALPSGPGVGYQQDADSAAGFDPADPAALRPVEDPYLVPDPTITIRPGQTRTLTLLMDPGLSVHVTSGVLPRKEINLLRDWVEAPIRAIAPSFRVGPVLVEPGTIRMPKPAGMPGVQHWTRRSGPTSWRDDPIEAASQQARLPDGAHVAQEGWIRLVYEETTDG